MKPKPSLLYLFLFLAAPTLAAAVDPFYLGLLRDGRQAYDRKEYAAASRLLNLACFGMLDEPKVLADCLARLALSEDKADDVDGFRETFKRIAEVEERFSAYSQGELPPELRAALEPRLVVRLPAATLESVPVFRPLVAKKSDGKKPDAAATVARKVDTSSGGATVKKPESTPPAMVKKPESTPPAAPIIARKPDPAPTAPATATKPPATAPAQDTRPLNDAERKKMDQARQLLSQERSAKELKQAFELAREVADAHPGAKEAQHLAAEAAYRISRWSDAATYFHRGGDPGEDEPERLFYLAVALHELGDDTAAAGALKRALPNLRRTPYVDSYAKTILGQ